MRINEKIVDDFLVLQEQLPQVIEAYGLKHSHIYKKAGITKSTWFRKLKEKGFSGQELKKICQVINA